ncbi:MAG: hypothetical protein ABGY96_24095 [bacterium]|nr:hypothetical protein [Gammaproteobacteria bacterium]HIL97835.1 hypothetical protein [Pseudomonadales bacterium]
MSELFSIADHLYRQRELNFLSVETWEQHEAMVVGMLLNPLVARWWATKVTPDSTAFRTRIDQARSELGDDAVWEYTPLSEI